MLLCACLCILDTVVKQIHRTIRLQNNVLFQVFFPTNFEHYIAQMELRDADQNVVDPNPTAETLIIGPDSKDLHLNTRTEVDCVHCYDDAFFGLPIDQVRCVLISVLFPTFLSEKIATFLLVFMQNH